MIMIILWNETKGHVKSNRIVRGIRTCFNYRIKRRCRVFQEVKRTQNFRNVWYPWNLRTEFRRRPNPSNPIRRVLWRRTTSASFPLKENGVTLVGVTLLAFSRVLFLLPPFREMPPPATAASTSENDVVSRGFCRALLERGHVDVGAAFEWSSSIHQTRRDEWNRLTQWLCLSTTVTRHLMNLRWPSSCRIAFKTELVISISHSIWETLFKRTWEIWGYGLNLDTISIHSFLRKMYSKWYNIYKWTGKRYAHNQKIGSRAASGFEIGEYSVLMLMVHVWKGLTVSDIAAKEPQNPVGALFGIPRIPCRKLVGCC